MSNRTPATEREATAIYWLKRVSFAPATWDKRFVRQLHDQELTDKERPQLWRMAIKYRRQIGYLMREHNGATWKNELFNMLAEAAVKSAPDFRRQAAAGKK